MVLYSLAALLMVLPFTFFYGSFVELASMVVMYILLMQVGLVYSTPSSVVYLSSFYCMDELSFWLMWMSAMIILSLIAFNWSSNFMNTVQLLLLYVVCLFFTTPNFFTLYVLYEVSLIPIAYIIIKWGVYTDRSKSVIYMMIYTTLFSFPLMLVLLSTFVQGHLMFIGLPLENFNDQWFLLLICLSFMVKLPIYGVHYWLPLAHVEAPTFGSMILAGILLKLGGYGLIRLFSLFSINSAFSSIILVYIMLGVITSSFITCVQMDFKRLVAYSSVVHMTALVLLVLFSNVLSITVFLLIMILHGILSPAMFNLVGLLYSLCKTRVLMLVKGVANFSFVMASNVLLLFSMNIPTPPFPQFFGEVFLFVSTFKASLLILLMIVLCTFVSLVYNLLWLMPLLMNVRSSSLLSLQTVIFPKDYSLYVVYFMFMILMFLFVIS